MRAEFFLRMVVAFCHTIWFIWLIFGSKPPIKTTVASHDQETKLILARLSLFGLLFFTLCGLELFIFGLSNVK